MKYRTIAAKETKLFSQEVVETKTEQRGKLTLDLY